MSPRPLLRPARDVGQLSHLEVQASTGVQQPRQATSGPVHLGRRSPRYAKLLAGLDSSHVQLSDTSVLREAIAQEFPIGAATPVGLTAQCYLGAPYEVHTLDLVGQIVEHYEVGRAMPLLYERARRLALHPAYVAIEVYSDRCVCVRDDGSVTEVRY